MDGGTLVPRIQFFIRVWSEELGLVNGQRILWISIHTLTKPRGYMTSKKYIVDKFRVDFTALSAL